VADIFSALHCGHCGSARKLTFATDYAESTDYRNMCLGCIRACLPRSSAADVSCAPLRFLRLCKKAHRKAPKNLATDFAEKHGLQEHVSRLYPRIFRVHPWLIFSLRSFAVFAALQESSPLATDYA
jgi:hypothetical protein